MAREDIRNRVAMGTAVHEVATPEDAVASPWLAMRSSCWIPFVPIVRYDYHCDIFLGHGSIVTYVWLPGWLHRFRETLLWLE
jgi:hypothetical protein